MFPGIMRSGGVNQIDVLTILKPLASITGRTSLSKVPGLTVGSITSVAPIGKTHSLAPASALPY